MKIDFKKFPDGLVPTIIQDSKTNVVLMLGYMSEESLAKTTAENRVTFFSRSKNRLWTKGEESGNFLDVNEILIDCDSDAILIKATPRGPVCHTGDDTCFREKNISNNFLDELTRVIKSRRESQDEKSYLVALFKKGLNKIAQKVGEEAVEVVIEAKDDNLDLLLNESADLVFHLMILLEAKGVAIEDVIKILRQRNQDLRG